MGSEKKKSRSILSFFRWKRNRSSSSSDSKGTTASSEPLQLSANVPGASVIIEETKETMKSIDKTKEYASSKEDKISSVGEEKIKHDNNAEKLNAFITETTKEKETTVKVPEPETTILHSSTSEKKSRSMFSFFRRKKNRSASESKNNKKSLFSFIRKRKQKQKKNQ